MSHELFDMKTGKKLVRPVVTETTKRLTFKVLHWVTPYKGRKATLRPYVERLNIFDSTFSFTDRESEEDCDLDLQYALRKLDLDVETWVADVYVVGYFEHKRMPLSWWWAYSFPAIFVGWVLPIPLYFENEYELAISLYGRDGKRFAARVLEVRQELVSWGSCGLAGNSPYRWIRNGLWAEDAAHQIIDMVQESHGR